MPTEGPTGQGAGPGRHTPGGPQEAERGPSRRGASGPVRDGGGRPGQEGSSAGGGRADRQGAHRERPSRDERGGSTGAGGAGVNGTGRSRSDRNERGRSSRDKARSGGPGGGEARGGGPRGGGPRGGGQRGASADPDPALRRPSPEDARGSRREPDAARPDLPDDIDAAALDPEVRRELATLPKGLAELVAGHLVAAGLALEDDPEAALAHARFARSRAGRVAAVREATGLAAYHADEWSEALTELRAARRLSGRPVHLAVMADCERALGRPDRALGLTRGAEAAGLSRAEAVELRIVGAGARRDLGQLEAAVVALQGPDLDSGSPEPWVARLRYAHADNLLAAGREQDAMRWFLAAADADDEEETDAAARAAELGGCAGKP